MHQYLEGLLTSLRADESFENRQRLHERYSRCVGYVECDESRLVHALALEREIDPQRKLRLLPFDANGQRFI